MWLVCVCVEGGTAAHCKAAWLKLVCARLWPFATKRCLAFASACIHHTIYKYIVSVQQRRLFSRYSYQISW
jgi:hypothetical protein